jgi:hypothetical protein
VFFFSLRPFSCLLQSWFCIRQLFFSFCTAPAFPSPRRCYVHSRAQHRKKEGTQTEFSLAEPSTEITQVHTHAEHTAKGSRRRRAQTGPPFLIRGKWNGGSSVTKSVLVSCPAAGPRPPGWPDWAIFSLSGDC